MRAVAATAFALVAFAANSVLCRLALGDATVDAATFSTIRLASGAITLAILTSRSVRGVPRLRESAVPALLLFAYAVPFSFAYTTLAAGTGALILFGTVQLTMMVAALRLGERPAVLQWVGWVAAVAGLAYLVSPGVEAPSPAGAAFMAVAGVAWGLYTLRGRGVSDPSRQTRNAFVWAVPLALVVSAIAWPWFRLEPAGAILAIASGSLASGVGYVVWYVALPNLPATRAASVQLAVPVIAALGGVWFLGESLTARLAVAGVVVLGGVALTVWGGRRPR